MQSYRDAPQAPQLVELKGTPHGMFEKPFMAFMSAVMTGVFSRIVSDASRPHSSIFAAIVPSAFFLLFWGLMLARMARDAAYAGWKLRATPTGIDATPGGRIEWSQVCSIVTFGRRESRVLITYASEDGRIGRVGIEGRFVPKDWPLRVETMRRWHRAVASAPPKRGGSAWREAAKEFAPWLVPAVVTAALLRSIPGIAVSMLYLFACCANVVRVGSAAKV